MEKNTAEPKPTSKRKTQNELHSALTQPKKVLRKGNLSSPSKGIKGKDKRTELISTVNETKGCGSPIDDLCNESNPHTGHKVNSNNSGVNKSFINMSTQHGQNIVSKEELLPVNQDNIFSSSNLLGSTDLNSATQNENCSSSYTAYESQLHSHNIAAPAQHNHQVDVMPTSTFVNAFQVEHGHNSEPLSLPDRGCQQSLMSHYQPEVTPITQLSLYSDQIQRSVNNSIANLPTVTSSIPSTVNAREERTTVVNSSEYSRTLQTINSQYKLKLLWGGTDGLVTVENCIDRSYPPLDYNYISCNIYREGVPDLNDSTSNNVLCGCECFSLGRTCEPKTRYCCAGMAGSRFAYTQEKTVRVPPGTAIYECNTKCTCSSSCINRVVQHGAKVPLCIFRTTGKGWGVKAAQNIRSKSFASEYLGEVITKREAERRVEMSDGEGKTYQFDLDFEGDNSAFVVDAANFGNVSHFFNHSVS